MGLSERLYRRLPVEAQHAAVSAYGLYWYWLRFGPGYRRHLAGYLEREASGHAALATATELRLREILATAADHVPFYADTWSAAEKRAAREGRLGELPLLGKEGPRAESRAFVDTRRRAHELVFATSGSTGTPIATVWTRDELRESLALREARSARWAGTSFRRPRATFSGRMVEPDPASAGPFHRFNLVERQVYLSAFHLSAATAPAYAAALCRHRVEWLTGYAVSFHLLARHVLEQGLELPPLRAVVTTSEKLTAAMRRTMEEAYGCRIFEEYSTVENAVFASECSAGRLHVSTDAGIVEILRPDGSATAPGEVGEVVATGLLRRRQPFVRFRLGDLAAWSDEPCPCGRPFPVLAEVVGRVEDVIVAPDGRQMVRFHGVFVDLESVREGQVVQRALDRITVRVVPAGELRDADRRALVERVRQRLGDGVAVEVETVEAIPRTAAGKYRAVVSEL